MPSRSASGPPVDADRAKALIVSQPLSLEEGFHVLDVDLATSTGSPIDLLGLDRASTLCVLAVAGTDLDAALIRLLDQRLWIADQQGLLIRIHQQAGLDFNRPIRSMLLSPYFTERFLRRLDLLKHPVTPVLILPVQTAGKSGLSFLDARPIFGLPAHGEAQLGADGGAQPGADAVAQSEATARAQPAVDRRRERRWSGPEAERETPIPVAAELVLDRESEGAGAEDIFAEQPEPADPFEILSTEEMDEFERFERERLRRRSPA